MEVFLKYLFQKRHMIMYKKKVAQMYYTNIELSKTFGGGTDRSKTPNHIAMIRDIDSCNRARIKKGMVLNLKHTM